MHSNLNGNNINVPNALFGFIKMSHNQIQLMHPHKIFTSLMFDSS